MAEVKVALCWPVSKQLEVIVALWLTTSVQAAKLRVALCLPVSKQLNWEWLYAYQCPNIWTENGSVLTIVQAAVVEVALWLTSIQAARSEGDSADELYPSSEKWGWHFGWPRSKQPDVKVDQWLTGNHCKFHCFSQCALYGIHSPCRVSHRRLVQVRFTYAMPVCVLPASCTSGFQPKCRCGKFKTLPISKHWGVFYNLSSKEFPQW